MEEYIKQRTLEAGNYILETGVVLRQAAFVLSIPKSTIHRDVTINLPRLNPFIAKEVRAVLDKNKAERSHRGAMVANNNRKKRRENIDWTDEILA